MKTVHILLLAITPLWAAERSPRWALILADPPLAAFDEAAGKDQSRQAVADHRLKIELSQDELRRHLVERRVRITGAVQTVLNAVFVVAPPSDVDALRNLPGVLRVVEMEPVRRHMVRAGDLVKASEGWRNAGGEQNAGAGVKIGVLDTGIDHAHAAFQDPGLAAPGGFPRCRGDDCNYANNKVIVARSYVQMLVLGDVPQDSRPDDLSARDRVGHGTAVAMVAAGVRHQSPLGALAGIAPRAHLGSYKIFGSPGVNDVTFDDVIIQALDDAVSDGMDIVVLSLGRPAMWAPQQRGGDCDLSGNLPCDPRADAVENAVRRGLTVVVSAGNDGDLGVAIEPALNSIHSPGTAPSALTVGATTNAQRYFSSLRVSGTDAPQPLQQARVTLGDGPRPQGVLTAPVRDVAAMQDDGRACSPLASGSLAGAIALIQRGNCGFAVKVGNAQKAGAVAVLVQQTDGSDFLFPMNGLEETGIPAAMIGSTAGKALQQFLAANPDRAAGLDPALTAVPFDADFMAYFSSFGPSIADGAIKPEVAAVGYPLYMATQKFDPNGDMYSVDGYISAQGTSFSAPIAAGAAALFKQRFRTATPAQVKSAVVNTATTDVLDVDNTGRDIRASVMGTGAGKVDAGQAARTNVTADPATISFGYVTAALPLARGIRIQNHGSATLNLQLQVRTGTTDGNARVTLSDSSFALGAGQNRQITARLEGTRPIAGAYEGEVVITGGASTLRIPYLYLVGDGATANAIPLRGTDFSGTVGGGARLALKLVDKFGVPVARVPVTWRPVLGDGRIRVALQNTDQLGIADASVILGPRVGEQGFEADAGGLRISFFGLARAIPLIRTDGVVNAASNQVGRGLAPGSYAAIYGTSLSDAFRAATTTSLPLSLAGVSVSFDVPDRKLSLPGRLHFVSDGQINVQVPWELQGLNSAVMKVSIENTSSDLYTVPLNDVSPALFEFQDPGSGRLFAAALDETNVLVTTANPLRRGGVAQLYANGLGPVDNQPATGEPAPAQPYATTRVQPSVTVGGRPADVLFSGLAPGYVGLYQLNIQLAPDTPSGVQQVVVTVGGISSKVANLPIQ